MRKHMKYIVICTVIMALGILIGPAHKSDAASQQVSESSKDEIRFTECEDNSTAKSTDGIIITVEKALKLTYRGISFT
ncbi:MAG: hypothetical protein PUC65_16430 [Clostridiales bacterium]|nr:hypothetical protein [Clostridiales bacterium]